MSAMESSGCVLDDWMDSQSARVTQDFFLFSQKGSKSMTEIHSALPGLFVCNGVSRIFFSHRVDPPDGTVRADASHCFR